MARWILRHAALKELRQLSRGIPDAADVPVKDPPAGMAALSCLPGLRSAEVCIDQCARRAGPREHGRQAARSKRDRPERARERKYRLSHDRAAAGGA